MAKRCRGTGVEDFQYADEKKSWKGRRINFRYRWENMFEIITGEASKVIK